ncbi:MAG: SMP-30/gluconolactonase/LRE family protein [Deltaproteobacteria bacterium]|nr:SMP-30/gluconolactonase/LRE family protein [Deltaproteobacteria bacterium]MBW2085559.1 SMP-30/gluconolactonase/LRE family protein [Deltaproteobacteria bacterium]
MRTQKMRLSILLAITAMLIAFQVQGLALAEQTRVWVYTKLPGVPEGLCIDSKNNLYATVSFTGELVKLKDNGAYDHVAWVPTKADSGKGQVIGIEADKSDNILVTYKEFSKKWEGLLNPRHPDCNDVTVKKSGVYKVNPSTGKVTPVLTRAEGWPVCFPDDIAVDNAGNIYVSDLTYSGIWKISPDGKVTMWCDDPLLNWSDPSLALGVNVIVLDKQQKNIYAATTTIEGRIVKIPIKKDGSAGKPRFHSRMHTYFDGIEIDDEGYIYASEPGLNQIIVVSPKAGFVTPRKVIARGAPLEGPTSLVLRDGVLYTANLAYGWPDEAKSNTVIAIKGFTKK